jgi:hypothetical protein
MILAHGLLYLWNQCICCWAEILIMQIILIENNQSLRHVCIQKIMLARSVPWYCSSLFIFLNRYI